MASKHHAGNSNVRAFVAPTTLDLLITFSVVREFLVPKSSQSTLYYYCGHQISQRIPRIVLWIPVKWRGKRAILDGRSNNK